MYAVLACASPGQKALEGHATITNSTVRYDTVPHRCFTASERVYDLGYDLLT